MAIPAPNPEVRLFGVDLSAEALEVARTNLHKAELSDRVVLRQGDAFDFAPPPGPGLILVNPPHGERLAATRDEQKKLGDMLKQRYAGWRALVLAGGADRGKHIGLRPSFRLPLRVGPLDARILGFELY